MESIAHPLIIHREQILNHTASQVFSSKTLKQKISHVLVHFFARRCRYVSGVDPRRDVPKIDTNKATNAYQVEHQLGLVWATPSLKATNAGCEFHIYWLNLNNLLNQ